jgi:hypothetical protein
VKRFRRQPRKHPDAWQVAAEAGCDMALLADNLAMTPSERVLAHRSALRLVEQLQSAMDQRNERSGKTSRTAHRS